MTTAAASGSEWLQPPPLAYKKWALHEQDYITDHVACGWYFNLDVKFCSFRWIGKYSNVFPPLQSLAKCLFRSSLVQSLRETF